MEGKGNFVVLLVIVAFLSLTLAVLAGYVFFVGGNSQKPATEASQKETTQKPAKKDLAELTLFEKQYLNLKKGDQNKLAVIQLSAKVEYIYALLGKDAKTADESIKGYESEMKEAVIAYFSTVTIEEASNQTEMMDKAKKDLTKKFNEIVPADTKTKKNVVYTVVFDFWFTQ